MAPELPDELKEEVREFLKKKEKIEKKSKAKQAEWEHPDLPDEIRDALAELDDTVEAEASEPVAEEGRALEPETEEPEVSEPKAEEGQAPEPETEEPEARIHVVEKGDSLWRIAEKFYGDGTRWNEIYQANKDRIKDPKVIRRGQKLRIP